MADNEKFYVLRGDKVLVEGMSKEEVLNAIVQAVEQGEIGDIDKGFITSIKEQNSGVDLKLWRGTRAQYNAIQNKDVNTYYIITDDDFEEVQRELNARIDATNARIDATEYQVRDRATIAETVYINGTLTGNKRRICFLLPLTKPIAATISSSQIGFFGELKIRQNGAYIVGSANSFTPLTDLVDETDIYTDVVRRITPFGLVIEIAVTNFEYDTTQLDTATNNSEIAIALANAGFFIDEFPLA